MYVYFAKVPELVTLCQNVFIYTGSNLVSSPLREQNDFQIEIKVKVGHKNPLYPETSPS